MMTLGFVSDWVVASISAFGPCGASSRASLMSSLCTVTGDLREGRTVQGEGQILKLQSKYKMRWCLNATTDTVVGSSRYNLQTALKTKDLMNVGYEFRPVGSQKSMSQEHNK